MSQQATEKDNISQIDQNLLSILVCPLSKTQLLYDKNTQELISSVSQLAYPIRNGIPILLVDEARKLENPSIFINED